MQQPPNDYKGLPFKSVGQATDEALAEINAERTDEQLGLYCSWGGINRGMGKYFRFDTITELAAPSGHGKSYAINQLHDDFTDLKDILNPDKSIFRKALNRDFLKEGEKPEDKLVLIHFGLEMRASDEVLRNLTRKIAKSYGYLLSSEWDYTEEGFNKISDEEYNMIVNRAHYVRNKPIYYVEMSGNTFQMVHTINYVRSQHPEAKIIVTIDHTLLIRKGNSEKTDMELVAAVGAMALHIRKTHKAMIILLAQTNQNLKMIDRMTIPALHYPNDGDIYMGSQINWVCDNIWIFPYRPELFNLKEYGTEKLATKDLVIAASVKTRRGIIGHVYLTNHLERGQFQEIMPDSQTNGE